jgi:hypothetical protein
MPEISVQPSTYVRLEKHAKAFVDTPETVILRALDALDAVAGEDAPANGRRPEQERRIDPRALPNLTHTKVLDASIDGIALPKPNWNLLLDEVLRRAKKQVGSFEKLRQFCPVNIVKGRKEDEGYSYLSDIDVSVQGQDANGACRAIVTAARGLGVALEIGFMWRLKEAAVHPGERARIVVQGTQGKNGQVCTS